MKQYFPKVGPVLFDKEKLLGLQRRLRAYMMTDSEGNMREGTPIVEGNPHGEKPAQGRRKQRARYPCNTRVRFGYQPKFRI